MANYCLPKDLATQFRQKLKSGEIDPQKLSKMTSEERHSFFSGFLGEDNAKNVNSLFESKLLLKNQQQGMISWAKKVSGISKQARADLIDRINKLDKVFNPADQKSFLHDLASTKLGTDITMEQSQKIFDLAQKSEELKQKFNENPSYQNRVNYGLSKMDTMDYVNGLNPKKANFIENAIGLPRSLVASLDFVSAPFRHGWGMMTRASYWKNLVNMPKYAVSEKAFRQKMADIISRDTYPLMQDAKVSIFGFNDQLSKREEQFMSTILDKFPITRGSQRAYMGFLNGLRADSFDQFYRAAKIAGEDVSRGSKTIKDIGSVVNNFTGAANLGRLQSASAFLNSVFFSPRKMVATIQMFNPVKYITLSSTARKEALRNLLGSVGASTAILSLAALSGAKVETDPTSTDFGQIRIGNTRIDVTGGNRTYITLLARLFTGQTKSSTTGIKTVLGQGYKPTTRGDIAINYLKNKLSPAMAIMSDWLFSTTKNQFNPLTEVAKGAIPLNITDAVSLFNGDQGNAAMGIVLSLFGLPVSSYQSSTIDWSQAPTAAQIAFKNKVSSSDFQKANQDFNTQVNGKIQSLQQDPRFISLSDTDKQKVITKLRANIEKDIFKTYGFTYHPKRTKKNTTINQLSQ